MLNILCLNTLSSSQSTCVNQGSSLVSLSGVGTWSFQYLFRECGYGTQSLHLVTRTISNRYFGFRTTKEMRLYYKTLLHTVTHTHPFNGPLSKTTRVSQYQKGKTNLDFTEARDSEWQWHQLGHMQVCTSLQTDNHTSTPPLSFLQAGCPSCRPTNSVKALKAKLKNYKNYKTLLIGLIIDFSVRNSVYSPVTATAK